MAATNIIDLQALNTISFTLQHPGFAFYNVSDTVIEVYADNPDKVAQTDIMQLTCEYFKLYTENKENYVKVNTNQLNCKFKSNKASIQIEGADLEVLGAGPVKIDYTLTADGFDYSYTVPTDSFIPYEVTEDTDLNARNITKLREEINALKETAGTVDLTDIEIKINSLEGKILEIKSSNNTAIKNVPTVLTQEEYDELGTYENKLYFIKEND